MGKVQAATDRAGKLAHLAAVIIVLLVLWTVIPPPHQWVSALLSFLILWGAYKNKGAS